MTRQPTDHRIVRSTTGIYHKALVGGSAAFCNNRSGFKIRTAQLGEVTKASEQMFCTKCFAAGKPTDFTRFFEASAV